MAKQEREFKRADGLHNFKTEAERKAAFPNQPLSLKQLKERQKTNKYGKGR